MGVVIEERENEGQSSKRDTHKSQSSKSEKDIEIKFTNTQYIEIPGGDDHDSPQSSKTDPFGHGDETLLNQTKN